MPFSVRKWDDVPAGVRFGLTAVLPVKRAFDTPHPNDAGYGVDPTGYGGMPVMREAADVMGWRAGPLNAHWGGPRPVTSTLIGAGLGALIGHGAGTLAEQFAPEGTFDPKAPRRKWRLAGAALGALPGLVQTYAAVQSGKSPFERFDMTKDSSAKDDLFDKLRKADDKIKNLEGAMPGYGQLFLNRETNEVWYAGGDGDTKDFYKQVISLLKAIPGVKKVQYEAECFPPVKRDPNWVQVNKKNTKSAAPILPGLFAPNIDAQEFIHQLITDYHTAPAVRGISAGLVQSASSITGTPLVSPWDIARIALATGSGAASGVLVGRTLGVLAGLSRRQQDSLQSSGWWAGLLNATVPKALNLPPY